jgi:hypothetical protein
MSGALWAPSEQKRNDRCNPLRIVDVCSSELLAHIALFELELAPQRCECNRKANNPRTSATTTALLPIKAINGPLCELVRVRPLLYKCTRSLGRYSRPLGMVLIARWPAITVYPAFEKVRPISSWSAPGGDRNQTA